MDSGVLRVVRGGSEVKAPPLAARPKPAGWCGSFLMVCRNKKQQEATNAGRLGAGLFSVCLETRWLGHFGGFYVPEPYCTCLHARPPCFSITLFSLSPTHSLTIAVTQTHTYALFTCVCLFLYHRVSLECVCVLTHTKTLSRALFDYLSFAHTHTLSLSLLEFAFTIAWKHKVFEVVSNSILSWPLKSLVFGAFEPFGLI